MGVEWGTVRRWERGEFLPPGGRLGELADALEATQAELVGTEAPPPDELSSLVGRIAREHPERVDMLLRILRSLAAP